MAVPDVSKVERPGVREVLCNRNTETSVWVLNWAVVARWLLAGPFDDCDSRRSPSTTSEVLSANLTSIENVRLPLVPGDDSKMDEDSSHPCDDTLHEYMGRWVGTGNLFSIAT